MRRLERLPSDAPKARRPSFGRSDLSRTFGDLWLPEFDDDQPTSRSMGKGRKRTFYRFAEHGATAAEKNSRNMAPQAESVGRSGQPSGQAEMTTKAWASG